MSAPSATGKRPGETIAIIGVGCRFPGGVDGPQKLWERLCSGFDAVSEVPESRVEIAAACSSEPAKPGTIATRYGAFLEDVEHFDAEFFGIAPREAVYVDPQQRLMLEVTQEAFEDAGLPVDAFKGSETGVFLGSMSSDYEALLFDQPERLDLRALNGAGRYGLSGRISFCFGFEGPSVVIDTACSSSLAAVHLACRSLQAGDCELAVAGGVNLLLKPQVSIALSQGEVLAADGRCKFGNAEADGFGRGEGAGVVVLKPVGQALADGDRIYAQIRGGAVTHDGRANDVMAAPSSRSQIRLLHRAFRDAGVTAEDLQYIEAHGTGTPVGDREELEALSSVLTGRRGPPCLVGSIKTNIAHTEGASGVAGLIKLALCLEHRHIPASLHGRPGRDLPGRSVSLQHEPSPWPRAAGPAIGGVNSFGLSGTNAHLILEQAPAPGARPRVAPSVPAESPPHLLALSAKSRPALRDLAGRYRDQLLAHPGQRLADVCSTAAAGRSHFPYRLSVAAASTEAAAAELTSFAAGEETADVVAGRVAARRPRVAFLFSGHGAEYLGMGRQLFETDPVARRAIECCEDVLRPHLERSLIEALYPPGDEDLLAGEIEVCHAALFAVAHALVELWKSWGIRPDAVLGHSVGEYAAACAAGVFSLEDGLKLVVERARLMRSATRSGSMAAVLAEEAEVLAAIEPHAREVSIAAVNGPGDLVISGASGPMRRICRELESRGAKVKRLNIDRASHSPLMETMLPAFEQVAAEVDYACPRTPIVSNVTGEMEGERIASPAYWLRHLCRPVRFAAGMKTLMGQGFEALLEIGPKPILLGMAARSLPAGEGARLASLRPGWPDRRQMLQSLGQLYVLGASPDWQGCLGDQPRRRVRLPSYPFQRRRYWLESAPGASRRPPLAEPRSIEDESRALEDPAADSPAAGADSDFACYGLAWRAGEPASGDAGGPSGTWLILSHRPDQGQSLARLIRRRGGRPIQAAPGEGYEILDAEARRLDFNRADHLERLLGEVSDALSTPFEGVVYWPDPETEPVCGGSLERARVEAWETVLRLVQTLVGLPESACPRLWLVTRGAVPLAQDPGLPNLAQAPVWGMARSLALEHPQLWGGILDLPAEPRAEDAAEVWAFLRRSDAEDQAAVRDGRRYVPRLEHRRRPEAGDVVLSADASYLITGGLGRLGLEVGRWLAARGARHLVLVGRHGASPAARQAVRELTGRGCRVVVARADVAEEADVRVVLAQIEASGNALRGIVHAAGVFGYHAVAEMAPDLFHSVLRPKVAGTWLLHELTRSRRLDFFISFSSMSSLLGFKNQVHYSAANHFLDVFAHYRRRLGLPALTVNWGRWTGGMINAEIAASLDRLGVESLPPQAIDSLGPLVAADATQAAVAAFDWATFRGFYEVAARRPLLERLDAGTRTRDPQPCPGKAVLAQRLAAAAVDDRRGVLTGYLEGAVASVLGFDRSWTPDPQSGFFELGMDSLMAVELRNRLQAALGRSLSPTLVFKHPTVQDLAGYLLAEVAEPTSRGRADRRPEARPEASPGSAVAAAAGAGRVGSEIAVIGMSGRFPSTPSLDVFWRQLRAGVESIHFFSPEELAAAGVPDELIRDPAYIPARGVLDGAGRFDAAFFDLSPREAERTDPQHRVFLECAWEALENAGYAPRSPGFRVGVFAGTAMPRNSSRRPSAGALDLDAYIGADKDYLPTRVSYKLDLKGPSINVQTACSTSLVAVHLACQSLIDRECDVALAGAVMILGPQREGYLHTPGGILSPDGRCRAFDARGQGFAFGNGVGVVVLKPLARALADRDRIRAVIRGSAINNDGAVKVGYTAPSVAGQAAVIREAQAKAGVAPGTVTYVESHGTGTELGDPIEIEALTRAFLGRVDRTPGIAAQGRRPGSRPAAPDAGVRAPAAGAWVGLDGGVLRESILHDEASLERQLDVRLLVEIPRVKALLDGLCASHVGRYLAAGVDAVPGAALDRETLRRRLRLVPELRRYLDVFLRILEEDGVLRRDGEQVRFLRDAGEVADPRALEREILDRQPGLERLVDLLRYAVESYDRSLTGEVSPVEVLHPDGTNRLVDDQIRENVAHDSSNLYCQLLIRTVCGLIATARRKVRILEAGAGSGLLTWKLLDTLAAGGLLTADRIDYCFTDVGQLYLHQARDRAARLGYEGLSFRRLDITADPAAQGFEPGSFDLLLSLNVLHLGPGVEQTTGHFATLLAPGGLMLAVELTRIERWHHLIYGLQPGWWDFADDIRPHSLFLDHRQWQGVLAGLGLEQVSVFPLEAERRAKADFGLLLGRRPERETSPRPERSRSPEPVPHSAPDARHFCALGSVKTNIGHLGPAAGVAGLIKTALALEHKELPPSLHFERPNPAIDFASSPFYVNRELRPWPAGKTPRRAGVSSFGIGGTNAHVVLEEAPEVEDGGAAQRGEQLLVLSARTPPALETATADLAAHLRDREPDVADVAYTLQVGRCELEVRRAVVCSDLEDAAGVLETRDPARLLSGRPRGTPSAVFLFPGQGAQYPGMGRELYEREPAFRRELDECCEIAGRLRGRDLRDLLFPAPGREDEASAELAQTDVTQPALFAVEYALAKLWMAWGVRPQAMIGHSLGEYVAACLAGVFSLEDALALVVRRGQMIAELPPGAMLALSLAEEQVQPYLGEELSLAAVNAPDRCVVSGSVEAVGAVEQRLTARGVDHRRLATSHAFHSPAVEPILETFEAAVRRVEPKPPSIPFVSNVTGAWITDRDAADPAYWASHMRRTVRWSTGLRQVLDADRARPGARLLLEVGPGRTLTASARRHDPAAAEDLHLLRSLPQARESASAWSVLLTSLGRFWLAGWPVDWQRFSAHDRRRRIELPTYPFERRRFGKEAGAGTGSGAGDKEPASVVPRLYLPSWRRTLLATGRRRRRPYAPRRSRTPRSAGEPRPWWVFDGEDALSSRLLAGLAREGRPVVRVRRGSRFERLDAFTYAVDPASLDDYRDLCREAAAAAGPPGQVVHLWALAGRAAPEPGIEGFLQAQGPGLYSLLWLAQAWQDAEVAAPLELSVVAEGLVEVSGEERLSPEKAPLLAACRVLPREHPGASCRIVDVTRPATPSAEARWVDQLLRELAGEASSPVVAYRGRHRWTEDFPPVELEAPGGSALRHRGVYLVTDGLGEIGCALAAALATAEARLVVTTTCELPAPEDWDAWLSDRPYDRRSLEIRRCRDLEEKGAEVLAVRAEVASAGDLRRSIEQAEERFGALHGIIHAAGALVDPILGAGGWAAPAEIERRARVGVAGALALAELCRRRDLDFVVLTSSLAPLLGRLGTAAQAAQDLFLDALARRQSQLGTVPWTSIGWDRWRLEDGPEPIAGGRGALTAAGGGESLRRILAAGLGGQVLVSAGDLEPRLEARARHRAELAAAEAPGPLYDRPADLEVPFVEPAEPWEHELAAIWQELLGLDKISVHDNFFQLGGDSLLATRVLSRVQRARGVELALSDFFEAATLRELATSARRRAGSREAVAAIRTGEMEEGEL